MAATIDGDNANFPGQVAVLGLPTSLDHTVTLRNAGTRRAFVQNLNLNAAAPSDLSVITVPSALYIPVRIFVYRPTANLSAANLGIYTAAGAGGTAIVAPVALASLTAAGKFQQLTIAAITDAVVATTLYPRLTVASGVAGTVSIVMEFQDLSLI